MSVGDIIDREERPAYVQFEKRPVEDKDASREAGQVIYKDVDYALVTPPYSKDLFEQKVDLWLKNVRQNVKNGRTPQAWLDYWEESYARWRKGEQVPLNGTSVKNWSAITPAQVKTLLAAGVYTIEDLASANDEGLRRLGMGAVELKNKARAYVQTAKDSGPLVMENAALKKEVEQNRQTIESLTGKINELSQRLEAVSSQPLVEIDNEITVEDILDLPKQYEQKFGKKPHHRMKEETMRAQINGDNG